MLSLKTYFKYACPQCGVGKQAILLGWKCVWVWKVTLCTARFSQRRVLTKYMKWAKWFVTKAKVWIYCLTVLFNISAPSEAKYVLDKISSTICCNIGGWWQEKVFAFRAKKSPSICNNLLLYTWVQSCSTNWSTQNKKITFNSYKSILSQNVRRIKETQVPLLFLM